MTKKKHDIKKKKIFSKWCFNIKHSQGKYITLIKHAFTIDKKEHSNKTNIKINLLILIPICTVFNSK